MNNYDNEIFSFDDKTDESSEQSNGFYYDSINGLGESNYENEDLFDTETLDNEETHSNFYNAPESQDNLYRIFEGNNENDATSDNTNTNEVEETKDEVVPETVENSFQTEDVFDGPIEQVPEVDVMPEETENTLEEKAATEEPIPEVNVIPEEQVENISEEETVAEKSVPGVKEEPIESTEQENNTENEKITMSETPIEELNKLTEYTEDKIETTDINELFERVNVNVKDASDIFKKNTDLKQKIDARFEELKKLQSEIENTRKNQVDEINKYKEDVLNKLTEKKEEIEKRLNILKETQSKFEKEKQEFEQYRRQEQENIEKVQKEVQASYDSRREELGHIEDVLRKQKDALDEERNQLSLDRIAYESDKNELANNLLKFNDIVNSFTKGVDEIKE